ncbi:MAG: carboxypeptidase-like regulatory domain-containing protein, partial [Bacteroidia bacterium]
MILKSVHKLIFSVLFLAFANTTFSQEGAVINGRIIDKTSNTPLSGAVISIKGISGFSETDSLGYYKISAPSSVKLELTISLLGYESTKKSILLKPNESLLLNFDLESEIKKIKEISIEDKQLRRTTMQSLDPKLVVLLPTTGGVESLL